MSYHVLLKHRCRVCWDVCSTHSDYQLHAIHKHGAVANDPMLRYCQCHCKAPVRIPGRKPRDNVRECDCPGVKYSEKPANYGTPVKRKTPDLDAPIRGKDGNLYVPQRLPE